MLKTISGNSSGNEVKVAQYLSGFSAINAADGVFSATFSAFMRKYQSDHKLTADGIVGANTWRILASNAPTCSTAKNRTSAFTCAIQLILGSVDVDGIFGQQTKKAVVAFQVASNITADGIVGKVTWTHLVMGIADAGTDTPAPMKFRQPMDYKQGDSRWGSQMYSNHGDKKQTMANSACGPTSMADIVATLKDPSIFPPDLAKMALNWGDRTASNGTAWSFFKHIMKEFGFSKMVQTTNLATLKSTLENGGYAVCSMGPGYWTKGGHYICVWKFDDTYMYANDPASSTRKKQKITEFVKQRKQYFCFMK